MSNGLYSKGREKFLCAEINWLDDDIKAALVDAADYTVNLNTHEFLSDIPLIGRTAISNSLADKTITNGWAGSSSIVFESPIGDISEAFVIFKDTGAAQQSWKVVTTSGNGPERPFTTPWVSLYHTGASSITPYFDVLRDGSTTAYKDTEVWAEFRAKT